MRKFVILSFAGILGGFLLIGCQREQGVQAGSEQGNTGTYQPRPAPKGEVQQNPEMSGELQRVDMASKTISIRVDDGMEQTFKFDNDTAVMGLENQPQVNVPSKKGKANNASIRNLIGKEGSEVTVQWRDQDGAKMATHIDVTQLSTRSHAAKKKARKTS
jgi:uncharacterized protein YcfL